MDLWREDAVLRCLMAGMANQDIADRLGASLDQVKSDVSILLRRYNARNRVELVIGRVREGMERIGKTL